MPSFIQQVEPKISLMDTNHNHRPGRDIFQALILSKKIQVSNWVTGARISRIWTIGLNK